MSDIASIPTRSDVEALQAVMAKMQQLDLPTKHHFADGMYARELFRPAGTTIIGKVHKKEHFYIVLSGDVTIVGDGTRERVLGPRLFISKPGTKRAVYAHTDAVCLTIHRVSSTDVTAIEAEIVEPDETARYDALNHIKTEILEHQT